MADMWESWGGGGGAVAGSPSVSGGGSLLKDLFNTIVSTGSDVAKIWAQGEFGSYQGYETTGGGAGVVKQGVPSTGVTVAGVNLGAPVLLLMALAGVGALVMLWPKRKRK